MRNTKIILPTAPQVYHLPQGAHADAEAVCTLRCLHDDDTTHERTHARAEAHHFKHGHENEWLV